MKEVFIIHVTEQQLINLSAEDFKKLLKLKDICQITGFQVKVNKEIINQLKETLEFVKSDPDYRRELFTGWEDQLELLLENTRELNEDLFLYSIKADYDRSDFKYHYKIGKEDMPLLIGPRNINEIGNKLILVDERKLVETYSIIGFDNEEALMEFLGREREYHWSPKHGENGRGHWSGESPLLCNKFHPSELIKKALQYPPEGKVAWIWDETELHYLKFYYEGNNPQNLWHAHHIIGQEQRLNEKVPHKIKNFFQHYDWD